MSRARLMARQRGMTVYLFVVFTLTTLGLLFGGLASMQGGTAAQRDAARVLVESRRAVLAYLMQPDVSLRSPADDARRLGEWRLTPDLPIAAGAGEDVVEPSFDGLAETGCAYRTWAPGAALQPVAASGAAARCFGRLPYRTLGVVLPEHDPGGADPMGMVPWVVMSPNLAATAACLRDLNPLMLSVPWGGYACPTTTPYPWLRVVDERGNLLSDRVAFAVILPGPPQGGQVRGPAAGPGAWLDTLVVAGTCAPPCTPGTYSNADFAHPDNQATTLVRGPQAGSAVDRTTNQARPVDFNDRLLYVTADELFDALEVRARNELVARLNDVRNSGAAHFPWAAAFDTATGDCVADLRFGHPATACASGPFAALPAWFTGGGWQRYFVYAASPRCVQTDTSCVAPGLTLGARTDIQALIVAPGRAIQAAPFAPSRLLAQAPLVGALLSANAADLLDSVENASANDVFEAVDPPTPTNNDRLTIVR